MFPGMNGVFVNQKILTPSGRLTDKELAKNLSR